MSSTDDDEASCASSGSEMLNTELPFSQDSRGSTTPGKEIDRNNGADDDEDTDTGEPSNCHTKKRKRGSGFSSDSNEAEVIEKARKKIEVLDQLERNSEKKIGTPDKLHWRHFSKKGARKIIPVRVVPREETVGLDFKECKDNECIVMFLTSPFMKLKEYAGKYDKIPRKSLVPFYGDNESGDTWCPTMLEKYLQQMRKSNRDFGPVEWKTEQLYLEWMLQKSVKEEEEETKRAELDVHTDRGDESMTYQKTNEDGRLGDTESDDEERTSCQRRCKGEKSVPLRVGDMIQFYNPQFGAGDERGKCQATILAIDPKADRILTIDSDIFLPPDHQVKRTKRRARGGRLEDFDGAFQAINKYSLKKEGDKCAQNKVFKASANAVKGMFKGMKQKAKEKAEAMGLPTDIIRY